MVKLKKIISGGQCGADQAGLDAAMDLEFPYGGWIPKGRRTERGPLSNKYNMVEHQSMDYVPRTKCNVVASNGTIVFTYGRPTGGSALTIRLAVAEGKPWFHANLSKFDDDTLLQSLYSWCLGNRIRVLNVAGSRESKFPGIYNRVYDILILIIKMFQ